MSAAAQDEPAAGSNGDPRFVIRTATRADTSKIVALWRDLQDLNGGIDKRLAPKPNSDGWFRDFLTSHLGGNDYAWLVAEDGGDVVGYAFGQVLRRPTLASGDSGYVADLIVRENRRGQGIGKALFHGLRAWFAQRGITALEVQVVRRNTASQAFWRKMGFGDFLRTLRMDPEQGDGE